MARIFGISRIYSLQTSAVHCNAQIKTSRNFGSYWTMTVLMIYKTWTSGGRPRQPPAVSETSQRFYNLRLE
ncbi:hypothetical protein BDR03DRAFT_384944 [Suillus americanus]|nr:hypothetical protein BDR03DRAFT_384944 [Suillus americanus]